MTEIPTLPVRVPTNRAMAATLHLWHNRNRDLLERVAAGLREIDDIPQTSGSITQREVDGVIARYRATHPSKPQ